MKQTIAELLKKYPPDELLQLADELEQDAQALRRSVWELQQSIAFAARCKAKAKLTPQEKRYCRWEGIRQKDFLARKRGQ